MSDSSAGPEAVVAAAEVTPGSHETRLGFYTRVAPHPPPTAVAEMVRVLRR